MKSRSSRRSRFFKRTVGRRIRLTKTECLSGHGRRRWWPPRWTALAAHYRDEDKKKLFEELKIFLTGGASPLPTYAELSERLSVPASSLRSDVTRLRARYREALRAEVRRTVEREAEVEGELRELLRVLTSR